LKRSGLLLILVLVVMVVAAAALLLYPSRPRIPKPAQPRLFATLEDTDGNPQTPSNAEGITVDSDGNVYVGLLSERAIVKITQNGEKSVFAKIPGQGIILGLAIDSAGNIYVGDFNFMDPKNSCDCIRMVTPIGNVTVFASGIEIPNGLAFDREGNLLVTSSSQGAIYKIDKTGKVELLIQHDLLKSHDHRNPFGANGIAVTKDGIIYVANTADGNILKISDGEVSIFGPEKAFQGADGLALDSAGILYVAENRANRVSAITPAGERIVIAESDDSDGSNGELESPASLVFYGGNLYVTNADFQSPKNSKTEPPYTVSVIRIG